MADFPSKICIDCVQNLLNAISFRDLCRESEKKLLVQRENIYPEENLDTKQTVVPTQTELEPLQLFNVTYSFRHIIQGVIDESKRIKEEVPEPEQNDVILSDENFPAIIEKVVAKKRLQKKTNPPKAAPKSLSIPLHPKVGPFVCPVDGCGGKTFLIDFPTINFSYLPSYVQFERFPWLSYSQNPSMCKCLSHLSGVRETL